jgi:hypothetical protein
MNLQAVKLNINEHLPLVLPVCPLPQTTCTYHVHSTRRTYALCYTQHSTTSYYHTIADSATIGNEVCRSVILKLYIRLVSGRKYRVNNSNRRTANLFYIHNKSLHVSTHQCHHQNSSTERIDRIQLF